MALLPPSLSPHVCILSSPDLISLLESSSLPPLPRILQSFSPLPNVTTRSTSLTTIPHSSFALRFSDLLEIEAGCREDDDQRAERTIDWIGARVDKRCAKWVQDVENTPENEGVRTPWWDELRHCAEGEHIPSKTEGWNHPVSIIVAVSTLGANPLQSITTLHSRELDFPSWVDSVLFRYTLIVHPKNSPLSNQEVGALFNAVKKQFGLHSYLLPLELPSPPPPQIPVPALLPRLPPPEQETTVDKNSASHSQGVNTLRLFEGDIQQTGKFTREFVVMSLVPWMEKCVLEWNETFSSTRRLPSRLFSSTRRLFGSPSPSPAPAHNVSASAPSLPRSSISSSTGRSDMTVPPPSQQRRLAEFAIILGDYKPAIAVLESLRKDGKPAADILPMLLSPSPIIPTYVLSALSIIYPSPTRSPPKAQLRALMAAVRWEAGIPTSDFLSDALGGERWLVWAAGDAEETTSALLLAHAALLCTRKGSNRRAAFYYLMAASKLEKVGVKPLTMHFLRKAHELYTIKRTKLLSPSFWDSSNQPSNTTSGFDAILSGIEHPLGRLLYTTGDVAGAVKLFVGLLQGSIIRGQSTNDKAASGGGQEVTIASMFLEDFRVAVDHLKSTVNDTSFLAQLRLPTQFCIPRHTRLRLSGNYSKQSEDIWEVREEAWLQFRREGGDKEQLEKSGKAVVGETFWIDLVLQNPLDTEINLTNFTVVVQEETGFSNSEVAAQIEVIDQVVLAAEEKKQISLSIKPLKPTILVFHQVTFDFLSLLPTSEPLSYRGQRLHNTPAQRQVATYAPDIRFTVDVVKAHHRLAADFSDDQISLLQGEYKDLQIWLSNTGINPITELWIVVGTHDELWFNGLQYEFKSGAPESEILLSPNSLKSDVVYRVPNVATEESPFQPGDKKDICFKFRAETPGRRELSLLLTYRQRGDNFQSIRLSKEYDVQELFGLGASTRPCESMEHTYMINLEITNNHPSDAVELLQVSTLSPTWKCTSLKQENTSLYSSQSARVLIGASLWSGSTGTQETLEHAAASLGDILSASDIRERQLLPIEVLCNHVYKMENSFSVQHPMIQRLIQQERQQIISQNLIQSFPQIPARLHPSVFPLYNPFAIDILIFWTIPSQNRFGHVMVSGLTLGARHALLQEVIEAAENIKASRSMYAETQRERAELLATVRNSDWNVEMNPLSVTVQDDGNVTHDFSKGPCILDIPMVVRNYSVTHRAKFILKFPMSQDQPSATDPPYMGRTSFRGTIEPCQSMVVRPKLWLTQPGAYSLDSWTLSAEMLTTSKLNSASPRHYTRQSSPVERAKLIISDIRST